MAESVFGSAIEFLDKLGLYDVLLPFLLVFTIVFAILDKTKVLGTDTINGEIFPRRNLNAMVAFVLGFLVVASANLVATINEAAANIVLLLFLIISFLMLLGSLTNPEDMKHGIFLKDKSVFKIIFMIIIFIGVSLIFLNALKSSNADICPDQTPCTWIEIVWDFLSNQYDSAFVSSIILLLVLGGLIVYITKETKEGGGDDS